MVEAGIKLSSAFLIANEESTGNEKKIETILKGKQLFKLTRFSMHLVSHHIRQPFLLKLLSPR